MKVFDVAKSGIDAAAAAAKAVMAPIAKALAGPEPPSPDAQAELRRRAEINARGEARRAALEHALFGSSRWIPRRSGWLERGR